MRIPRPVLLIHGGAGNRSAPKRLAQVRRSLRAICLEAYEYLRTHSAFESVAFAVRQLEDDPLFNAGTGSFLQRDGRVRMSASIMDGCSRRFASVLNIEQVKNPILVAKTLLRERDRSLAGPWATRFAQSLGFPTGGLITPTRLRQWQQQRQQDHGTVGAVALDGAGRLAAATSTGGKGCERPGRVSDSGLPVGTYADEHAAISCTGIGEDIMDEGLAIRLAHEVRHVTTVTRAFFSIFQGCRAAHRRAGAIGLDRHGQWAWSTTLPLLCAMGARAGRLEGSF